MKSLSLSFVLLRVVVCVMAAALITQAARAESIKVEIQLVWATDDAQSPDPGHKAIEAALARRLHNSPYRWKNYFEVSRVTTELPQGILKTNINVSKQCSLDIKYTGKDHVKVT